MATAVIMPKLGLTMVEGTIVEWKKKEGETVVKGEILVVIETEKVTYEVEASESGTLGKIMAKEGDVIPVGGIIAYIIQAGEKVEAITTTTFTEKQAGKVGAEPIPITKTVPADATGSSARIKSSPIARKMAAEHNIDLSSLKGTGPYGRIVREDVLRAVEERMKAPVFTQPVGGEITPIEAEVKPLSSMRKIIAKRMTESFQSPHFYLTIEADTQEMGTIREQLLPVVESKTGIRLTHTDLLIKMVAKALEDNPSVNCSYIDGSVRLFKTVNIGLVTSVEGGLVVPVIRQANTRPLMEIVIERARLVQKAKGRKLIQEEMSGSTFTISNMGMFGIVQFSAILQPPEAAILAVSSISDRVIARDGQIVIRPVMILTLSIDHRVLDAVDGARFLESLKKYIENPTTLLL